MSSVADSIRPEQAVASAHGAAPAGDARPHVAVAIEVRAIPTPLARTHDAPVGRPASASTRAASGAGQRRPEAPTHAGKLVIERAPETVRNPLHRP